MMTTTNLPPTLDTDGLALELVTGHYRFAFSNFQSPDRSDSIRLELLAGAASYNLGDGWVSLEPSLELDFEYFDRYSNDIEIRIETDAQLTLRTREGWAYPYDDAPTHPLADWAYDRLDEPDPEETLLTDLNAAAATNAIAYPLAPTDILGSGGLGSARTVLRTDGDEVPIAQLEQQFFPGLDLAGSGLSGSAGLWTTQPGIHRVTFDLRGDYDRANLLFWNGQSPVPIDETYISNSTLNIYIDAVSDEWGFILLDSEDVSDETDLRISSIEWIADSGDFPLNGGYIANSEGIVPADSIGNARIDSDAVVLSTGEFDRAASSLGDWVAGDRGFFNAWGTEGTAATYTDLEPGIYEFDWSMYSSDRDGNDALYAWNGKDLVKIGDRASATQISPARWTHDPTAATVEVVYDYVTLIALDEIDKRGPTDFTISGFYRTGDLGYEPPQPIEITPDILTGDVNLKDGYTGVATGTGDRAISTISEELTGDGDALAAYGTEGSYAKWMGLENGTYEVIWSLYASENDVERDAIYFWDGSTAQPLATRADATIQSSATRWISDRITSTFDVTGGELGFLALDELDKSGTTEMRIYSIEKVGG